MGTAELEVLKPSRKKPQVGDVFVFRPQGRDYYFGRVIRTDARIVSFQNCILIYLYSVSTALPSQDRIPSLALDKLLLPPIIINRLPWSRGYFMTIGNSCLEKADVLETHCFKRNNGKYYDADSNELPAPVEPVGQFGLWSYALVGDVVEDVLANQPKE